LETTGNKIDLFSPHSTGGSSSGICGAAMDIQISKSLLPKHIHNRTSNILRVANGFSPSKSTSEEATVKEDYTCLDTGALEIG
jgi:hypothetical protein